MLKQVSNQIIVIALHLYNNIVLNIKESTRYRSDLGTDTVNVFGYRYGYFSKYSDTDTNTLLFLKKYSDTDTFESIHGYLYGYFWKLTSVGLVSSLYDAKRTTLKFTVQTPLYKQHVLKKQSVFRNVFWRILGDFWYNLGVQIGPIRKPFSKTRKFGNPSKTIVFPMYFEGWVLKYQVTIYEKIDKNIVSKSITKNWWKS